MDFSGVVEDAESVEQPPDERDRDNNVEDGFDRPLHRDERVGQPEDHANDDQSKGYANERHGSE
jgi:hypothetical protein